MKVDKEDGCGSRLSIFGSGLRTLLRSRSAVLGAVIVGILIALATLGPNISPHDPVKQQLIRKHEGFSGQHLLGTDQFGRDILSRIMHGARISISLSLGAVAIGMGIGVPLGMASAYYGGKLDLVTTRLMDVVLSIPTYLFAILLMAVLGSSLVNIALAVGVAIMPSFVRVARADTLRLRNTEMIEATQALGVPTGRILLRHVLPNILSSVFVQATLWLGGAILVESSLSFLGLGLSPPKAAWGLMVSEGLRFLQINPRLSLIPGIAIMITVLGFNLLGDGIRDAMDPRLRKEKSVD